MLCLSEYGKAAAAETTQSLFFPIPSCQAHLT
jgi:hypothetical protein